MNKGPVEQPRVAAMVVESRENVPNVTPFRWEQLEAEDYPTYIANLRAARCPERMAPSTVAVAR